MKKILIAWLAVFCLGFSVTGWAFPELTITDREIKQEHYLQVYPKVSIAGELTVSDKINTYFARNAEMAFRRYEEEKAKGVKKTEENKYVKSYYGDKYLSFTANGYMYYQGAAHPLSWLDGVTFDLATGDAIPWQKLIKEEDQEDFTLEAINSKILNSTEKWRSWLYRDFAGLKKLPRIYYLDREGYIHFVFGQYEIATYAAGIIDLNTEKQCK